MPILLIKMMTMRILHQAHADYFTELEVQKNRLKVGFSPFNRDGTRGRTRTVTLLRAADFEKIVLKTTINFQLVTTS